MKRAVLLTLLALLIFVPAACAHESDDYYRGVPYEKLLDTRQIHLWIEGEVFGDMLIGARAKFVFIYIDRAMVDAIGYVFNNRVEDWIRQMTQCWGIEGTENKKLIIANCEAYKLFELKPDKIRVGDYEVKKSDVVSSSMTNPFYEMHTGENGFFAFAVPQEVLKSGEKVEISYGEFKTEWTVPK